MKRYPFAKLYLSLLLVMACISAFCGIVVIIMKGIELSDTASRLNQLNNTPIVIDTERLFAQMRETINSVRSVSPTFTNSMPTYDDLTVNRYALLKGKEIKKLNNITTQYKSGIPEMKQTFLLSFDTQLKLLEDAARARQTQIIPTQRETTRQTIAPVSARLYNQSILQNDSRNDIKAVSEFLKNKIQYYSPSAAAHDAAMQANDNVLSALSIYEDDFRLYSERRNDYFANNSIAADKPRPQFEVLNEFVSRLQLLRTIAHDSLTERWTIEDTISDIEEELGQKMSQINDLKGIFISQAADAAKSILLCVGIAVLLLVVRDFLSTAIDTAQNTGAIRDTLAGSDVKVD